MKDLKTTKGDLVIKNSGTDTFPFYQILEEISEVAATHNLTVAKLIVDGYNTAQKCGLLPSELLKQRDKLREALADMVWQFAYRANYEGRENLHTGGLSALESAFDALGISDPITVLDFEYHRDISDAMQEFATLQNKPQPTAVFNTLEDSYRYHAMAARATLYPGKTVEEVKEIIEKQLTGE